ncbi:MAG: AAA family ATPase [Planctomycetes bacterium]|nr:AAA family ATPase [Planctomycetota bacterium]
MQPFLQSVFGDTLSEERRLLIFCLPSRHARFFASIADAAGFAAAHAHDQNIYFGLGLIQGAPQGRGRYEDIAAIPGLWADLDLAGSHRGKAKSLPNSIEDIKAILDRMPLAPSMLVQSGHGVHAYWLFKEPWVFEQESDRAAAYGLAMAWHRLVCDHAHLVGFDMENLGDLTRVLRLPGTLNHNQAGQAVRCELIEEHACRRYNRSDFEPFLSIQDQPPTRTSTELLLRPDAEPPADRFVELYVHSPVFAASWRRQRPDLRDQSQSAYDLSLANVAALNGWGDQEIANLLVAARRKHRETPEKSLRQDYIARTLAQARRMAQEHASNGVDLTRFLNQSPASEALAVIRPKALFEYDPGDDPNALLGSRWLCRSGSCLIVGQTGLGKSSFSMQAAVTWALGEALFGIRPVRPLRSLVLQAENDLGDLAEMFAGVLHGTDRLDRLEELDSRLVFVTEAAVCGKAFHAWARALVLEHKPDLVWMDPLFAYLGGNASDQETVSTFLRNGLGAIAQETGCAWMIVHHANKPPKDMAARNALVSGDYSYLGAGSAELANWARAVLTLREVENALFELRASKRGKRAGLLDADGQPATEVFLSHGSHGICWERANRPEEDRARMEQAEADEVIAEMEAGKAYSMNEVRKLVERVLGVKRQSVLSRGRRANRVFNLVLEQTKHPHFPMSHCRKVSQESDATDCRMGRTLI